MKAKSQIRTSNISEAIMDESGKKLVRPIMAVFSESRWVAHVLYSACYRFYWDNGFSRAASLAYSCLLSIIPFFTLGFGMIAYYAAGDYAHKVQTFIFEHFVPTHDVAIQIIDLLNSLSTHLTSIGKSPPMVAFFVMTSLLLINAIEAALNETWQVHEPRPIVQRIGIFSTIILIVPVIALSGYIFMEVTVMPYYTNQFTSGFLPFLVPFFITLFAFLFLFYFVPRAPVKFSAALFGAFITAGLFMGAYSGFAFYISFSAYYMTVYSTVASIPIFLVWLYLCWILVLFGAECSYQAQYLPRHGQTWRRSVHSIGDGRLILITQSLIIVARRFLRGEPMPDSLELAEILGCSSVILKPALAALEAADVIVTGEGRDRRISLLRSPDLIYLNDISDTLYKGTQHMRFSKELARLFDAGPSGEQKITLMDLVRAGEPLNDNPE